MKTTYGRRPQPRAVRARFSTLSSPFAAKPLVCAIAAAMFAGAVGAAPVGEQVTAGQAGVTRNGTNTLITQTTERAAINWQSFNIAANEAVRFAQPSASSIALNRVLGQDASSILGALSANGQVFILNPNGVLFGAGAQVTVGGLVASSLGISDNDFMGGRYSLTNAGSAGAVVNAGDIIADGGYVALIAPQVRNEGRIVATGGNVSLVAADRATVHLDGNRLIGLDVEQGTLNALAENKGLINADGGAVLLTAKAADALIKSVVNNEGVIEANTMAQVSGTIRLLADGGETRMSGTLSAAAPNVSNGGDGGSIETSGISVSIADNAVVTTAAPYGRTGTWLIDPQDFTIQNNGNALSGTNVGNTLSGGTIGATTLGTMLGSSSVVIQNAALGEDSGNINVQGTVTWASANTLTLNATNNINFQQTGNGLNGASGSVVLNAKGSILGSGSGVDVTAASLTATATNFGIGSSKTPLATSVGALTIQAQSDVFINNAQSVTLNTSKVTFGQFVLNNTVGATSTVTLAGSVSANREGTGLQIVAGRFVANPGATLSAGAGGRWLVWSTNPTPFTGATSDQRGDLVFAFKQYNTAFGGVVQGTGNGFIYALAPTIGFTLSGVTKVYDGDNSATLTAGNYSLTGLLDGDQATATVTGGALSGSYNFANASNNPLTPATTVTALGSASAEAITSSAASGSKPVYGYAISTAAATGAGSITQRAIQITAATNTRTYDGSTGAGAVPTLTSGTIAPSQSATYSEVYSDPNAGTGKTLVPSVVVRAGDGVTVTTANYAVTAANDTTGVINQRPITVSAQSDTKTYDGTTAFSGVVPTLLTAGTLVEGQTASYGEVFADLNAGTGKTLIPSVVIKTGGTDVTTNYAVTANNNTTGVITARPLTVTAATNTRVFDGTAAAAAVPTITGGTLAGTDTASFSESYTGAGAANAGSNKTLAPAGTVSDGNGGLNYAVTFVNDTTGVITARPLTVTAATNTKVFDGGASAAALPAITSGTLVEGNTASFVEAYSGAGATNAGSGKTLAPSGSVSDGNGGLNYAITFVSNTTGVITARPLTVTAATNTKVFDGGASAAAVPTITGGTLVEGNTANFVEAYSGAGAANAGSGKTLAASGSVSDGNGGLNYAVTFVNNGSGVITARPLTVTAATNTKVYDGSTGAAAVPIITSGTLVEGNTASFVETYSGAGAANTGSGKTLAPTGTVSDGNGGLNYAVTFVNNTGGVITARPITVTAATNTKVFDGATTAAAVPTITDGTLAGADTASFSESYTGAGAANAGSGKTLAPTGTVIDGNGGLNYAVTFINNGGGVITPRPLTVTAATNTKVFDGSASAAAVPTITSGTLVEGNTAGFVEAYSGAGAVNAGSGKTLTPSGSVGDGAGGLNYTVTFVNNTTGVITARPLTVTAATNTKVYDGSASAAVLPTITSGTLVEGSTANFAEVYSGAGAANAGTAKTLAPSGSVSDGNGGLNYAVTFVNNTDGVITARPLTVTATANTKVFDGTTTAAAVPTITGGTLAGTDTASFSEAYAGTGAANAGSGKTLTPTGVISDGNGGLNYAVSFTSNTSGVITAKPLTIAANNTAFISGTTLPGFSATSSGLLTGDTLASANFSGTLLFATPASSNSAQGTYVITPSGLNSTNYSISYVNGTLTAFPGNANINIDDILASLYSSLEIPEFPDPGDKNKVNVENGGVNTTGI